MKRENANDLRKLLQEMSLNLRPVQQFGKNLGDDLMVYLISSKLDPETRKGWEKTLAFNEVPTLAQLEEYLGRVCNSLEAAQIATEEFMQEKRVIERSYNTKPARKTFTSQVSTKPGISCHFCNNKGHYLDQCEEFLDLKPDERKQKAREKKLCLNCLRPLHDYQCQVRKCMVCRKQHNTLLHSDTKELSCSAVEADFAYLPTCEVEVMSTSENSLTIRGMLDSGSQINLISRDLVKKLGLKMIRDEIQIKGVSETGTKPSYYKVCTKLRSRYDNFSLTTYCHVVDKVTSYVPPRARENLPARVSERLADRKYNRATTIEILLGAEVFFDIIKGEKIMLTGGLFAQDSTVGWLILGKSRKDPTVNHAYSDWSENASLNENLKRFWELEEVNNEQKHFGESKRCLEIFNDTTERAADGKFIVSLPFKCHPQAIGESYEQAERRFLNLESRLRRNPVIRQDYANFMLDYEVQQHMERCNNDERSGYFLPHHPVIKEKNRTTKLRVVFDASARGTGGVSLNECLLTGPTLQDDLFDLLIRFRSWEYVLTADLKQMYRQVWVKKKDTVYQKILWRPTPQDELAIFRLKTVTYGTAPASFLATRCLVQISDDIKEERPMLSKIVMKDFYVDDLLTGSNESEDILRIKNELTNTLSEYGFKLHKWCSNIVNLSSDISENIIEWDKTASNKVLGIQWDAREDAFQYKCADLSHESMTKRAILSAISRIFDPIGLLAPITVRAKLVMQKIWQTGKGWDETLPEDVASKWLQLKRELSEMELLSIPRGCIGMCSSVMLIVFCDASQEAYGASIYVRAEREGEIKTALLCSKSKVAPLKSVSLPRLELCAAHLGAKLAHRVEQQLDLNTRCRYYTDSTIVLTWIKMPSDKLKCFVANRVAEIQELSQPLDWHHVRSRDNPADIVSRGATPSELRENSLWWSGPSWLREDLVDEEVPLEKIVPETRVLLTHQTIDTEFIDNCSEYEKLLRVTAYCLRFIRNCKGIGRRKLSLATSEIQEAEIRLLKLIQCKHYRSEIEQIRKDNLPSSSDIIALNPFIDEGELIRVGGRLRNSDLLYETKHPILLPANEHLTRLIIRHEHKRILHGGNQLTLSSVRQRFWPISGRRLVRSILRGCIKCLRNAPRPLEAKMADLLVCRVREARPFLNTGVDFCGPFDIKSSILRNAKIYKGYVSIFVCMATKAVHLEVVAGLDSSSFLAAFRRFVSRRGMVSEMFSDNGTNFKGADRELKELFNCVSELVNSDIIQTELTKLRVKWNYNPPVAPHHGGLWEAAVKSFKYHFMRTMPSRSLTFEQLTTLAHQVEAVLNSRPLCPLPSTPDECGALCPSHFLIGDYLTSVPAPSLVNLPQNRLDIWQTIQSARDEFWRRWRSDYLHELQRRSKWRRSHRPLEPNQVVILIEEEGVPGMWPLGRVVEAYRAKDGQVRSVRLKTDNRELVRPITKVCPLPITT